MSISGINAYGNSSINYSAPKSVAFRGEEVTSSAPQAAEEPKKKGHGGLWLLGLATAGVATYLILKKKNKATTEAAKEAAKEIGETVGEKLTGTGEKVGDAVADAGKKVGEKLTETGEKALNYVKSKASKEASDKMYTDHLRSLEPKSLKDRAKNIADAKAGFSVKKPEIKNGLASGKLADGQEYLIQLDKSGKPEQLLVGDTKTIRSRAQINKFVSSNGIDLSV